MNNFCLISNLISQQVQSLRSMHPMMYCCFIVACIFIKTVKNLLVVRSGLVARTICSLFAGLTTVIEGSFLHSSIKNNGMLLETRLNFILHAVAGNRPKLRRNGSVQP